MVTKTCVACRKAFDGHFNAVVCSPECRRDRRRGLDAGVSALPKPTRTCVVCGREFLVNHNLTCCSPECLREKQRQRWRAGYHSLSADQKRAIVESRKRRRREDPAWAHAIDARKYGRIKSDPDKLAAARERARQHYARRRKEIQDRRRAIFCSLTPEERTRRLELARRLCREHRRRVRAGAANATDPTEAERLERRRQRYADYEAEYRRLRREERAIMNLAGIGTVLADRSQADAIKKPCIICGQPVVARHPSAKTCSVECRRRRHLDLVYPPRIRPCVVCGASMETPTAAKCCSDACKRERKRQWKRQQGRSS